MAVGDGLGVGAVTVTCTDEGLIASSDVPGRGVNRTGTVKVPASNPATLAVT